MTQFLVSVRSRAFNATPHHLYLIDADFDDQAIDLLAAELLHDQVVQEACVATLDALDEIALPQATRVVEVAYLPGVTDNEAESVRIGAERLGLPAPRVRTLRRFLMSEQQALRDVYNPLIQNTIVFTADQDHVAIRRQFYATLLQVPVERPPRVAQVPLREAEDDQLMQISRTGILSLDETEMRAIQAYFQHENREPTDGELETLAQTWSEHCSHKTFKARVRYQEPEARSQELGERDPQLYAALDTISGGCEINSLIKTFLMRATDQVLATQNSKLKTQNSKLNTDNWVLSAFVDNAGIVAFGDDHELSIKVETHNHPSALEPFGGANTGVGGVVRDVLGVSAQPIANTNVLCFGPLDLPPAELSPGVLHPQTVASGVVAGVRDYGNKLGIPTVNGAVLYEQGYTANPLVFCGTVGLAPRGKHPRNLQPGDQVVVLGGRTGRDGIHGATFSSVELTHTTAEEVGSAVQIGDPITEKKMLDVLLQARDQGLYSAITDCGAGGLSSAVGEMGAQTGVRVMLDDVLLKYAGLQPWEIWISEAQERLVIAVPPMHLAALLDLCRAEDVEATVIGEFTADQRLLVSHGNVTVVDLSMAFLHDGRPQRVLDAVWKDKETRKQGDKEKMSERDTSVSPPLLVSLSRLLAHPNIASKEAIIRTYDHEVGGRTVIKPLVGVERDGPGDAAVLRPLRTRAEGVALGCGINPRYGEIDPYWMALAVIDEALRNVVAVGGDPARTVILDNFCWGDPRLPDRMAGLVRAVAGCYDAALAFGTPFISGKDSLNNEYRDASGTRHAIPPTLLVTALAHVPDVGRAVTMDLKQPGNQVYLVGLTKNEFGGAHIVDCGVEIGFLNHTVPMVDLAVAPGTLGALHGAIAAGLVRACHDLSEGGLAVAAAEMAFAGGHGLALDLETAPTPDVLGDVVLLFAESPTRFLVEVEPKHARAFEAQLAGVPFAAVGSVISRAELVVTRGGAELIRAPLGELKDAWQATTIV